VSLDVFVLIGITGLVDKINGTVDVIFMMGFSIICDVDFVAIWIFVVFG
jgi:hypothetical protein